MGATGCGKSTIGSALSVRLNASLLEGDDYHSPENKAKMRAGTPLSDTDRWPWLQSVGEAMRDTVGKTVVSCSALKRSYRTYLSESASEPVLFVYLQGSKEILTTRLAARKNHFMNTDLLESQLSTLEEPDSDELSLTVDINNAVSEIVEQILEKVT